MRRLTRRSTLGGLVGLPASAGLVGSTSWQARAEEATRGGTVTVVWPSDPGMLVGTFQGSAGSYVVSTKIHDTLIRDGADPAVFKPAMATAWSAAPDGKEYRFTLRPDIKWHDGRPFTSADVAFSMMEIWKKITSHPVYDPVVEALTPDESTVVFRLESPVASDLFYTWISGNNGQVLAKHIYAGTDARRNPNNNAPTGTGAFRFKERQPGQYVILERNAEYWNTGYPLVDRLVVRFNADAGSRAAMLENGEADIGLTTPVSLHDIARFQKMKHVRVESKGYERFQYTLLLDANTQRQYTGNVLVRRAILHAIDRKFLVDAVVLGFGRPAVGPIHASSGLHPPDAADYPYDPKRANALLDEAGFQKKADGIRFALDVVAQPDFEMWRRTGEYMQQALAQVGIKVNLVSQDASATIRRVYTDYDFDLNVTFLSYGTDPIFSTAFRVWTKAIVKGAAFRNSPRYSNPELDSVIESSVGELDPERRKELFRQYQRIVQRDLPILCLAEIDNLNIVNTKLHNTGNHPRWYMTSWWDLWQAR